MLLSCDLNCTYKIKKYADRFITIEAFRNEILSNIDLVI